MLKKELWEDVKIELENLERLNKEMKGNYLATNGHE